MRTSVYPAILTPDTQQHGFVVTFPDVPEAITQGDDLPEALHQVAARRQAVRVGGLPRGTISLKHCIRPPIALTRPPLGVFAAANLFQRRQQWGQINTPSLWQYRPQPRPRCIWLCNRPKSPRASLPTVFVAMNKKFPICLIHGVRLRYRVWSRR
jgi:hypothetical protein